MVISDTPCSCAIVAGFFFFVKNSLVSQAFDWYNLAIVRVRQVPSEAEGVTHVVGFDVDAVFGLHPI